MARQRAPRFDTLFVDIGRQHLDMQAGHLKQVAVKGAR
jgi:hypothetical protein